MAKATAGSRTTRDDSVEVYLVGSVWLAPNTTTDVEGDRLFYWRSPGSLAESGSFPCHSRRRA